MFGGFPPQPPKKLEFAISTGESTKEKSMCEDYYQKQQAVEKRQ